jgi:hypothetical protein
VERTGLRHIVLSALEAPRLERLGLELHGYEEFGGDELGRSGMAAQDADDELSVRAVRAPSLTPSSPQIAELPGHDSWRCYADDAELQALRQASQDMRVGECSGMTPVQQPFCRRLSCAR